MKQPADDLFLLIRAMTPAEKRYFRLMAAPYSATRKDNKYLLLFDRIGKQEEYDEPALKRHFSKDSFLGRHFKKAKAHLYNLVLSTLERYGRDEYAQVQSQLHQSRILYRKGLYRQSGKLLARAMKEAQAEEYFTALVEAAEQQRSLIAVNREFATEAARLISVNTARYLRREANIHDMREIQAKIFRHFTGHHILRTAQQRATLKQLGKKLFGKEPEPLSGRAATILYNTMGIYYQQAGVPGKARRYFKKAMSYTAAARTPAGVMNHAMITSNYISACMTSRDYGEVVREATRLLTTCGQYPANKRLRQVECSLCHTSMSMYIATGEFNAGIEFSERVKRKYFADAILRDKTLFAFNSAVLHFGTGNYSQVLKLTNSIIRIPEGTNPIPKTAYWSRMLQVIALWESGDYELLDYRVKAFYAYLLKRGELYRLEKIILEFVRKNYTQAALTFPRNRAVPPETRSALVRLKGQLVRAVKKPEETNALDYFDFIAWLDSKIRNVSFSEVMREKARR